MSNINVAKISPRYELGKFYWYENDTFAIELKIDLKSFEDDSPITTDANDKIIITFLSNNIPIHKFQFNNVTNSGIYILDFGEEVTKKFPAGNYEYVITYCGINRTTIVCKNLVEVEK